MKSKHDHPYSNKYVVLPTYSANTIEYVYLIDINIIIPCKYQSEYRGMAMELIILLHW